MKKLLTAFLTLVSVASLHTAELTLTWKDNSDNETAFNIERSVDGERWLQIWQAPANTESFVDDNLPGDVLFYYRVNAENAAGVSGYTNVASAQTHTEILPVAPDGANVVDHAGMLINLSTRGLVTVDSVMIGGMVVTGEPILVLIRGIGPSLAEFGVANPLADPELVLTTQDGTFITGNDNWSGQGIVDASFAVGAFSLQAGSLDAALLVTLPPGTYTVKLVGGTGTGLLEIYHVK